MTPSSNVLWRTSTLPPVPVREKIVDILDPWADAVYRVGEAFGTIAAQKDGHTVEVTTFRKEVYRDDSRKPTVTYSDDIENDLSRRDFTVNAIACRWTTSNLLIHMGSGGPRHQNPSHAPRPRDLVW